MSKRKAPKRTTASTVDASTSIPRPIAMKPRSGGSKLTERDPRFTRGHAPVSRDGDTREVFSCVISLYPDLCKHHTCANCGGENKQPMWTGTVTDSIGGSQEDAFENEVLQYSDTPANRKSLMRDLQRRAQDAGYSHCEIRDYSPMVNGGYVPMYSGMIPALMSAVR